ncbi:MAG: vitamin K epoxide reductase family protein [Candidatus Omnitrophica bacterium]|nr:vitamin K epoxide reductase family protein [Candidatus Omnitrophota bacterium]
MIGFLVFVLCCIGLWISIYFTGVFYKWFAPDVFWIPKVCRLKEETCVAILDTPRATLFGIPNSAFGIGVYAYLLLNLFVPLPAIIALTLTLLAVLRSLYLTYSLMFVTKISCPLCFTTHAINLVLFLIILKVIFLG